MPNTNNGKNRRPRITSSGFPLGPAATSCGESAFAWMIHPITIEEFFKTYWEKKPLFVKRGDKDYYRAMLSTDCIRKHVDKGRVRFGTGANFVYYDEVKKAKVNCNRAEEEEGGKENGCGIVVTLSDFEELCGSGKCSMQLMHPQQFDNRVHALIERLENYFCGCLWGSNCYVTPSSSQGFAPHFDDVEVFMLQLEGRKRWRLYLCPDDDGYLPRHYSRDYQKDELSMPLFDDWVEQGDLLYLPRGTVHMGETGDDIHSSHLSVSTYQRNTWGDLLLQYLPVTLEQAIKDDVRYREGLPVDWVRWFGKAVEVGKKQKAGQADSGSELPALPLVKDGRAIDSGSLREARIAFEKRLRDLIFQLLRFIDVDDIADQHMVDFIALRTPPAKRAKKDIHGDGDLTYGPDPCLNPCTSIRWRNPAWVRVAVDADGDGNPCTLVFHCLKNSAREHMASDDPSSREPGCFELAGVDKVAAFAELRCSWPKYVQKTRLGDEVSQQLWKAGIIETKCDA